MSNISFRVTIMKTSRLFAILALTGFSLASSLAQAETPQTIAASTLNQWNSAIEQGDIDQIMKLYADNAMVLQPNGNVSRTREEIRSFWLNVLDSNNGHYSFNLSDIISNRKSIVLAAKWSADSNLRSASASTRRTRYDGTMTNVLTKQDDGSWKAQVQRWY